MNDTSVLKIGVIRFWILDFGFWIDSKDKSGGLETREIFLSLHDLSRGRVSIFGLGQES